jgi:hypothetical protein
VYVFNGRNLIGSEDFETVEQQEADCECCNLTGCLVPELAAAPQEEDPSSTEGDCTFVGYFIPELGRI